MAGFKACPRTGMIVRGSGIIKPLSFPITMEKNRKLIKKSGNMFPADSAKHQPVVQDLKTSTANLDQLKELAREIGASIAAQLREIPIETNVTIPYDQLPRKVVPMTAVTTNAKLSSHDISIDESVADVGIEEMGNLAKGDLSANLAKEEAKQDNIKSSLSKLKRLKGSH